MAVTCGTYNAGLTGGLTLAAVINPPRPVALTLEVMGGGQRASAVCGAGERMCISSLPSVEIWGVEAVAYQSKQVQWDAGDGPRSKTCSADLGTRLLQPEGRAEVADGKLEVRWAPVPGAATYVVTLRDLDLRPPTERNPQTLDSSHTTETHASFELPGTPDLAVVEIEAWATDPGVFTGAAVPQGGAD